MNNFDITIDPTVVGYWGFTVTWILLSLTALTVLLVILFADDGAWYALPVFLFLGMIVSLFWNIEEMAALEARTLNDRVHEALVAEGYEHISATSDVYVLSRDGDAALYTVTWLDNTATFHQISE